MATGLLALLDDIAGIAKIAAASVDDVAAHAAKAGAKAAGVVIDDAAVTPRYVVGFAAAREIPIVKKIAIGSLRNKLVFLLPAALALSAFAPWLVMPLLMLGGAFLCYEGAEKVWEKISPHGAHKHEEKVGAVPQDPRALEDARVAGAIRTDFILSAEIMAIALATITTDSFWMRAIVLAAVAVGITFVVYGAVAVIVKADDAGAAMARGGNGAVAALGRLIVRGMPPFLALLAVVGTAAMLWVGGGIVLHGLYEFGLKTIGHLPQDLSHALLPSGGFLAWLVEAIVAGVFGLLLGAAIIPLVERVVAPLAKRLRRAPAA
ncbi:DUF808 domain-containing protein [Falsiroseomonas bella]|uniref:DUF808 domain-containing protein n=1 Tax=Falsiroseomonas bella TaxID=2184016 RepID=A0A317FD21_9PROT|nr:DUF808 domain-containing protein [Falsiroseomonas bella]PWS36403.1 DUF808 domain-containing protein [Falsiroseomonas bella]